MDNSLKRNAILKLKTEIQNLFETGKKEYPGIIKILWKPEINTENSGVKIFVSVPKKLINKAVKRNLLKRRIKEALRTNLQNLKLLCKQNNIYLKIGVVYVHSSVENYTEIEKKIILTLQKICNEIQNLLIG